MAQTSKKIRETYSHKIYQGNTPLDRAPTPEEKTLLKELESLSLDASNKLIEKPEPSTQFKKP